MSIDWDGYEVYHPGVFGPLKTLPRTEARQAYKRLVEAKPARIEMLCRLLKANGVELNSSDAAIQDLNDWFRINVQDDPEKPGRLLPDWYSVVIDIGLFLGEVLIERFPNLHWEFYTWGKKNVSYQRHVIMGFSQVPNSKYNIDFEGRIAAYGHQIIAKHGSIGSYGHVTVRGVEIDVDAASERHRTREIEVDAFLRWVKTTESQA